MRRKQLRLPAVLGSALGTAFLAVHIAGAPAQEPPTPVLAAIVASGVTAESAEPAPAPRLVPTASPKPMPTLVVQAPKEPQAIEPPALVQAPKEQPKAPVPAAAPEQPAVPAPTQAAPATPGVSPTLISDILGGAGGGGAGGSGGGGAVNPASTTQGALSATQQAAASASTNTVGGGEAAVRATSDVGDLLGKSVNALGVWVIHRSPIITNPVVRGYHVGQYTITADGGYWLPARIDLDTIVSKIDSSQIENVVVIKGPYSVRYGPGFAFIDVETLATPRYQDGPQNHGQSGVLYKSNGQQWFGIQSIWGGDENSGYRATYGIGTGTDYWDGNGVRQPSGFHTQSFNLDYGFNIGQYGKLEVKAIHLEQTDVKIPGAPLDISYLSSDGYTARLLFADNDTGKFGVDGWFNYTRVSGNNFNGSKREQFPFLEPLQFFMTTDADLASAGYRAYFTLGAANSPQVTLGTDLRYIDSQLTEYLSANSPLFGGLIGASFPMPRCYSQNPGLFADVNLPLADDRLVVKSGVRFDWVRTAVSNLDPQFPVTPGFATVGVPTGLSGSTLNGATVRSYIFDPFPPPGSATALSGKELQRDFTLWSAFITPEWKVNDNVTLTAGVGMSQRPPTLNELYPIAPFTGVLQRGYNAVIGNPLLAPETLYQGDLGFRLNYDRFRGGASGYCSWVKNYVTYQSLEILFVTTPFDSIVYQYANTDALLWGGEGYMEYDVNRSLTLFGTMMYVAGRDLDRGDRTFLFVNPMSPTVNANIVARQSEWLPGLPPLEVRAGIRWRNSPTNPRWGAELTARMVNGQNQVAETLQEYTTPGYTIFDVRGYYRPNSNVLLTAGIENFTDRQYREWADYRNVTGLGVFQPGLNAYVGLRLTY